jgi:hypothetical protein
LWIQDQSSGSGREATAAGYEGGERSEAGVHFSDGLEELRDFKGMEQQLISYHCDDRDFFWQLCIHPLVMPGHQAILR